MLRDVAHAGSLIRRHGCQRPTTAVPRLDWRDCSGSKQRTRNRHTCRRHRVFRCWCRHLQPHHYRPRRKIPKSSATKKRSNRGASQS